MPRQTTIISVFLASPSDVMEERGVINRIINQWNTIRGKERGLIFEVLRWETHTSPAIGVDAQEVINTQINDDYDVMIAVFWTRLGTATARAASGTVEEYERALQRHRSGEPIQVGVYFKMSPPALERFNPHQYQGVLDLRDRLKGDGVYYKEFTDEQSLDFEINIFLDRIARSYAGSSGGEHHIISVDLVPEVTGEAPDHAPGYRAEDVGFLDVLESMEEHGQAANRFLTGATAGLEEIQRITEESARRIEELKALGPVQPADMKPIVSKVTESFEQFSRYVEDGLDEYSIHSAGIADETRKLIDVSSDFESSPEEVAEAKETFENYIESMSAAIKSMQGFAESVRGLQRMTVKFNHARKRLVGNVEKLVELIVNSRSVVIEAVENLPG